MRLSGSLLIFASLLTGCSANDAVGNGEINSSEQLSQPASATGEPGTAAVNFLNAYSAYLTSNTANISIDKWVEQSNMVTDEYLQKFRIVLATVDGDMGLEADPIMNAQDTPSQPFVVKSYETTTGLVMCTAGEGWDRPVVVKNINGRWLVDGSGMVNMPDTK